MVLHSVILATSLALPAAGTHWHGAGYPVESGRPAQGAHATRHRATHTHPGDRRQATGDSSWYLLYRAQHRRLYAAVVPAQPRVLRPGLLLHATGETKPGWVRVYDAQGKSWIVTSNLRLAAEPRGWARTVLRIHPTLRVIPPPLPLTVTGAAVTSAAAPAVSTPAPATVVVVPQVVQPAERTPVESIYFWAGQYGVNGDSLLHTAQCESGLNAGAYNPSGASGGLQFMPSTFSYYAGQLAWDHAPSYWNFDDSARVAAFMWSQGQEAQWVCYGMVG